MPYQLEKSESRLDNIRKVKPILGALRTISLGSWQMARSRRRGLGPYAQRLRNLIPLLLPYVVSQKRSAGLKAARKHAAASAEESRVVVLVCGSERGLCGRYNKTLLGWLDAYGDAMASEVALTYVALGSRMARELAAQGYDLAWSQALSITALPSYGLAHDLTTRWLGAYEAYDIDAVDVVYNADRGAGTYAPATVRLLPPEPPVEAQGASAPQVGAGAAWVRGQTIVATDPVSLYVRVVQHLTAIGLYGLLLEAAVTEHSARYQLMESATQNADDLVAHLMLEVQSARRQAITREMQELAIAAGLLGSGSGGR